MASNSPQGNGIISGINVTPKIIVSPAVPLDLPRATQSEEVQVVFSIIVPVGGPTLVNGEPAASNDVVRRLARDAVAANPELRAVINADGATPHRRVIELLDILKSAGIARVAFGALPPEPGSR
jgi:biopolymer transport protein ExbD